MTTPVISGIVLAAGAGTRFGGPKALALSDEGVPWVRSAVELLQGAGAADVTVILGAGADEARELVPAEALVVVAPDWSLGQAASLRAALTAVAARRPVADAALVTLVDLPGLPVAAALRVVGGGGSAGSSPLTRADASMLRQATFGGRPGHPVLIGRDHWDALRDGLSGDRGARPYLVAHGVVEVECGDLGSGGDVDSR